MVQMRHLFFSLVVSTVLAAPVAKASPEKEFIMSCTYGVLAGSLVGAASLAFEDQPGDNLQRVARGASLGLYFGIGLGLYTVYILPGQLEKEEMQQRELIGVDKDPVRFFPIAMDDGAGVGLNLRF